MNEFKITNIIILSTEELADWFLKNLYPHNIGFLIVTSDGVYPKDKALRERVWQSIDDDPKVKIIIFGNLPEKTIKRIKNIKTMFIYNLNNILKYELRKSYPFENKEYGASLKLNLNPANFMKLLAIITEKVSNSNRRQTVRDDITKVNHYQPYCYNEDKMIVEYDWKAKLIGADLNFKYNCVKIDFDEVCKGWRKLWPERNCPTHSTWHWVMDECITENHWLSEKMIKSSHKIKDYPVIYFGVYDGDKLIGVNSGHQTSDETYRSRGLWVDPKYRGRKILTLLLQHTIKAAEGKWVWSCSQNTSLKTYESVGFEKRSAWIGESFFKMGVGMCCFVVRTPC